MSYAIIKLGGKQYRVREGERLLVDRLAEDEGKTFNPHVLLVGGNGTTDLAPSTTVTARVVGHVLGEKIRIGKYKKRTGYRLHNGFRSRLTQIEIEAIGGAGRKTAAKKEAPPKAEATPAPKAAATPKPEAAPKAEAAPKPAAAPKEAAPGAEAPVRKAHPPKGYEELTVAEIAAEAHDWRRPNLEAALEYEREHANRKGALAALESALAAKEEH
jgi:large subunit ribosomal protein L21